MFFLKKMESILPWNQFCHVLGSICTSSILSHFGIETLYDSYSLSQSALQCTLRPYRLQLKTSSDMLNIANDPLAVFLRVVWCFLGMKPLVTFMCECYKNIWWTRPFRCWHNDMIYKELLKNSIRGRPADYSDGALLKVFNCWDPKSTNLQTLCNAVQLRHQAKIFPIRLIAKCADTINIVEDYFVAWKIIDLMSSRCIEVIGTDNFPDLKGTIKTLAGYVVTITGGINFAVNKTTTICKGNESKQIDRMNELIDSEKSSLRDAIKLQKRPEELKVLGYILNFLLKLVALNHDPEGNVPSTTLFDVPTQFKIEALGKLNRQDYTLFLCSSEMQELIKLCDCTSGEEVEFHMKFSI